MRLFAAFFAILMATPVFALDCAFNRSDETGFDQVYCPDRQTSRFELIKSRITRLGLNTEQKNYALVVGVSDYDHFIPLETKNDALKMVNYLINDAGFDGVHLLTDRKVSVDRVQELMNTEFPSIVGENDRFVFYWSGHGVTRPIPTTGGFQGYLPLSDTRKGAFHRMIDMADLADWDSFLKAKQVLYLLDSCFSGLAGSQSKAELRDLNLTQLNRKSRHLLTAGTQDEEVIVHDRFNGSVFTHAVIEGLRGNADAGNDVFGKDGVVSVSELKSYVGTRVTQARKQLAWSETITPQMREIGFSEGEFFFVVPDANVAPPQDVDVTVLVDTPADAKGAEDARPRQSANAAFVDAVKSRDEKQLMAFADAYADNTDLATRARRLAEKLFEDNLWQDAVASDTIYAFEDYLLIFPEGRHALDANRKIALLKSPSSPDPRPVETPPAVTPATNVPDMPTTSITPSGLVACRAPLGEGRVQKIRANDTLNIRSGPGTNFAKVGELAFNATGIEVAGCNAKNWCQVTYGCASGFAYKKYLTRGANAPASAYSGTYRVSHHPLDSKLNVRSGPSTDYPVVAEFAPDLQGVQVTDCQVQDKFRFRWCTVIKGEIAGWAYGKYLSNEQTGLRPTR